MAAPEKFDEDPGWPSITTVLLFMIPGVAQRQARKSADGLVLLRQVIVSFSISLVLFAVVLAFLHTEAGETLRWLAVLCLLAAASVVAASSLGNTPLDCTSPEKLAGSYKRRFFLRGVRSRGRALRIHVCICRRGRGRLPGGGRVRIGPILDRCRAHSRGAHPRPTRTGRARLPCEFGRSPSHNPRHAK